VESVADLFMVILTHRIYIFVFLVKLAIEIQLLNLIWIFFVKVCYFLLKLVVHNEYQVR